MAKISKCLNWPKIILASGSPRRKSLLEAVGSDFKVVAPRVDEDGAADLSPETAVRKLAREKALEVRSRLSRYDRKRLIVAADTVVAYRHHVLGKPQDKAEAVQMLKMLSGRWHQVYTGLCLISPLDGRIITGFETTKVKFRRMSSGYINNYVASGEPLDKAGAYGIQELGALLVERVDGCYFNVVGLPLMKLDKMIRRLKIKKRSR
ncbi:septum formation inhibitor Maf [candidate division TA06 bacterium]|uniref:dTTP/UTP pyrophosphatase n=1 Tax=candidate division TA06 bacterium TaxID=2250710 RepID=A0A933I9S6_UNCT6|nr:septum formation inhibitor Maf [candidate division TA06 bacterium]